MLKSFPFTFEHRSLKPPHSIASNWVSFSTHTNAYCSTLSLTSKTVKGNKEKIEKRHRYADTKRFFG
jgi:hypothetical protein